MSAHPPVSDNATQEELDAPGIAATTTKVKEQFTAFSLHVLDRIDDIIYAIVGVCFFLGALMALIYSFWDFYASCAKVHFVPTQLGQPVVQFISDLLLVLIITEVLGTVTHYLRSRATSLRPFLFIGIISATRGILSIGARLSLEGTTISTSIFRQEMIELGINAAIILALGITIKLLEKLINH
ncbi:MAG TPA: phosphate-starvation-inducible PsiE family protein [Dictyobacter sp.]|jgi:uncharacterized membrane protein (DUF373 family)|nr:phosphate-starvation-inducible PsiE family protein [Dictyobacter sp.]